MNIRTAVENDLSSIVEIYNQALHLRTATADMKIFAGRESPLR
jgi:L-amino acid N-acyltransferase YncA